MPDNTDNSQTTDNSQQAQTTPDAAANNTGAAGGQNAGAATDAATNNQATQTDITQTPEFKAALTRAIEKKIPQLKKQIAKDILGDADNAPSVQDLQSQLAEAQKKIRASETRDAIAGYVADPKNKISVKPTSMRLFTDAVALRVEYDDEGKPANLKEAIESVRRDAPDLFIQTQSNAFNGNAGNKNGAMPFDMNAAIRRAAGRE